MIAALRLGWRLATCGGRRPWRQRGAAAGGVAVATVIVATAVGLSGPLGRSTVCEPSQLACRFQLQVTLFLVFAVPGLVLVAAVSLLAATSREQRLAGLRLLGVGARDTRRVAVVETAVVAAAGSVVGLVLEAVAVATVGRAWVGAEVARAMAPRPGTALVTVALVAGTAAVAGHAGALRASRHALLTRRRVPGSAAQPWRLVPMAAGVALVVVAEALHRSEDVRTRDQAGWMLAAGAVLAVAGLVVAMPALVRWAGRALACVPGPVALLAGASLRARPSSAARVLSTFAVGLALATVTLSGWSVVVRDPFPAAALAAEATGPNLALARFARPVTLDVAQVPDALAVVPLRVFNTSQADGLLGGVVLVAGCDELAVLVDDAHVPCDTSAVTTYGTADEAVRGWRDLDPVFGEQQRLSVDADVPVTVLAGPGPRLPVGLGGTVAAVVPPSLVGLGIAATPWAVLLPPGNERVTALAARLGPDAAVSSLTGGPEELEGVLRMRTIVYAAVGAALVAVITGLALALVDAGAERRDAGRRLRDLGLPRHLVQRAFVLEHAVPTVVSAVLAVVVGMLVGAVAFATDGQPMISAPARSAALQVGLGALGAGLLVVTLAAVVTVPGAPRARAAGPRG